MGLPVGAHGLDHGAVGAAGGDVPERLVHDALDVGFHEGQRDAGGDERRAVKRLAVVGDGGGRAGIARRTGRVARGDEPPGINEDLPADLLGHGAAVLTD